MLVNINYHIWFKVCRSLRHKYNISINTLLVLNGCYVRNITTNKGFTIRNIRTFVSYFSQDKIKYYIGVLIRLNYIIESGSYGSRILYSLSPNGFKIIEELNDSYQVELVKFCNLYNIVL